jgi:phosphoribosylformylglycinamidine synthase
VQRGNPEIQRRAQEVINHCQALGEANPILAIHDVGAGGLSNAFPELTNDAGAARASTCAPCRWKKRPGAEGNLVQRKPGALRAGHRAGIAAAVPQPCASASAARSRWSAWRPRRASWSRWLDGAGTEPRWTCRWTCCWASRPRCTAMCSASSERRFRPLDLGGVSLQDAAIAVLSHPTVASKRFLVTIGDRTVGGLSHRDQMVGPWQVPVADCAVTLADYRLCRRGHGMGERTPLAALDAPASGRMAVAEAITNLLAAPIELSRVKLSANWMAACGEPGEDAALYDTVRAVGLELCPALGISHPGRQGQPVDAHAVDAGRRTSPRKVTRPSA